MKFSSIFGRTLATNSSDSFTNLFDGVSIVIERNNGTVEGEAAGISKDEIRKIIAESMRKISQEMLEE